MYLLAVLICDSLLSCSPRFGFVVLSSSFLFLFGFLKGRERQRERPFTLLKRRGMSTHPTLIMMHACTPAPSLSLSFFQQEEEEKERKRRMTLRRRLLSLASSLVCGEASE